MIELYPPATPGEWITALTAMLTIFVGLALLILPKTVMRLAGRQQEIANEYAVSILRGHMAGFCLGLGVSVLLLQQPLLNLALGVSWGFSAFGQMYSMLVERKVSVNNFIVLMTKSAVSVFTILAVLGYFG